MDCDNNSSTTDSDNEKTDVNEKEEPQGVVPEHLLKAVGDPEASIDTIKKLLKESDLRVVNSSRQNALHVLFQRMCHPEHAAELTKLFLDAGANVNALDYNFTTPFGYCIMNINRGLKYHENRKKVPKVHDEKQKASSHHMADNFMRMGFMSRRRKQEDRDFDDVEDEYLRRCMEMERERDPGYHYMRRRRREMESEYGSSASGDRNIENQIEEDTLYQDQIYQSLKIMLEAEAETSHCPSVIPHLVHSGMFTGSYDHMMIQRDQRMGYYGGFQQSMYRAFDPLMRGDHEVNKNHLFVWHLAVWRGDLKMLKLLLEYKCCAVTFMDSDGRYGLQFLYQYCMRPKDLPAVTALLIKHEVPLYTIYTYMLGLSDLLRHIFMKRSFVKYLCTSYCKDTCYPGNEDNYVKEIKDCIHMLHNTDWVLEHFEEIEKGIDRVQIPTREILGKQTSDYKARDDKCLTVLYNTLKQRMKYGRQSHFDGRTSPFKLSTKPLVEFTELLLGYNINVNSKDSGDQKTAVYYLTELWIQLVEDGQLEPEQKYMEETFRILFRYGGDCNYRPTQDYLPDRPPDPSAIMLVVITMLKTNKEPHKFLSLISILVEGGGDLKGFDYIGWIRDKINAVPIVTATGQHHHFWHNVHANAQAEARARADQEKQRKKFNTSLLQMSKNLGHLLSCGIHPYQPGGEEEYAQRVFKLIHTISNKFSDLPSMMVDDRNSKVAVLEMVNMLINISCMKAHAEFLRWYQLQKQDYDGKKTDAVSWINKSKYLYILLGAWLAKPRNLSHHARYAIWKAMGPNFHKVDQLGLPKALIAYVKDFIHPQLPQGND